MNTVGFKNHTLKENEKEKRKNTMPNVIKLKSRRLKLFLK